jgi:hypothetical protein
MASKTILKLLTRRYSLRSCWMFMRLALSKKS